MNEPTQATDDGAFSRIKENRTRRKSTKAAAEVPALGYGRLKPRAAMTEQERELFLKRVELSKQILNRNLPPVAENLVYLPGWNKEDGGELKRVGEKEGQDEDMLNQMMQPDDGKRALKSPLEVIEMIKVLTKFLKVR